MTDTPEERRQGPVTREALAFQSDVTALELRPAPRVARLTIHMIIATLAVAVAWAAWAQMDKVVQAPGRLVSSSPKLAVGPLEIATVRKILVRAGDVVRAEQPLAELDATFAAADMALVGKKLRSVEAEITRLDAELTGGDFDALAFAEDGVVQRAVLERRRNEREARLADFAKTRAETEAARATFVNEHQTITRRLTLAREIESMRERLLAADAGPRMRLLEARADRLGLEQEANRSEDARYEADRRLEGIDAKVALFEQEWRREVIEASQAAKRARDELVEELNKARRRNALVMLRAPVDAVVLDVADRAIGSIIDEAQPIVTLMPTDARIEAEVQIPAGEVGEVRIGDHVRLKLVAFPFQRHGALEGRVSMISEDAFIPETPGAGTGAYYRARVEITRDELRLTRPNLRLLPGMTLEGEVKVGTRTALSYFAYPIIRTLDESLGEP